MSFGFFHSSMYLDILSASIISSRPISLSIKILHTLFTLVEFFKCREILREKRSFFDRARFLLYNVVSSDRNRVPFGTNHAGCSRLRFLSQTFPWRAHVVTYYSDPSFRILWAQSRSSRSKKPLRYSIPRSRFNSYPEINIKNYHNFFSPPSRNHHVLIGLFNYFVHA